MDEPNTDDATALTTDRVAADIEARRRIKELADGPEPGADTLDLTDLVALEAVPTAIASIPHLRHLYCGARSADGTGDPWAKRALTDLSAIAALPNLVTLDVMNTPLRDITPLGEMSTLETLNLSGTNVTVIEPGWPHRALKELFLGDTELVSLEPFTGLSQLRSLSLSRTNVTDFEPLRSLPALENLSLDGAWITDLAPLTELQKLRHLSLRRARVKDLSPLIHIPRFDADTADYLEIEGSDAAQSDRRLALLSRLPSGRQATEVIQYLKGEHPDFGAPSATNKDQAVARILSASPVALAERDGKIVALNAGEPERVDPRHCSGRLGALRRQAEKLRRIAADKNLRQDLLSYLDDYLDVLNQSDPLYVALDGEMSFLRGALEDTYITEALDGAVLGGWRDLVSQHDELRPYLLPPEDSDLPLTLSDAATPAAGAELLAEVQQLIDESDVRDRIDVSVDVTLQADAEYFKVGAGDTSHATPANRKGWIVLGGVLASAVGVASQATGVLAWLGVDGAALATRLNGVWERFLSFVIG